jgi:hypothetical protein
MIDRNRYANLAEALADVTDIDKVVLAVVREVAIREMVAETGETREAVTTVADAAVSMGREAVLDLMDGKPTTLDRGLSRYVSELEKRDELQPRDRIVGELDMLLRYPWPGAAPGLRGGLQAYVRELEAAVAIAPNNPEARAVHEIVGRLTELARPGAEPTEQEWANFRNDVDVTLRCKLQPQPGALGFDVVSAEVVALVKDRFFPDR